MLEKIKFLKELVDLSVRENLSEAILLSGGLDSSVLAASSPGMKAITVSFNSSGEDKSYSKRVADSLGIDQIFVDVSIEEALKAIPETIKILNSFDPALPNDLAVYFGLKKAKELGIKTVMTGDGSDELFAGYSFMQGLEDLDGYIKRISPNMLFSSNEIGNFFNIKINQPFLHKQVFDFALGIETKYKIFNDKGKIWGKWILRKSFESMLQSDVIWQDKRPLEIGSGMSNLRDIISRKISEQEFRENNYNIKFINKEHMYYYKIYRNIFGNIPKFEDDKNLCTSCGAGLGERLYHCRICGWAKSL